jgi:branched-chain amino acid transport system substrate-binding protein
MDTRQSLRRGNGPAGRRVVVPLMAAVTLLAACGTGDTSDEESYGGSDLAGSPIVVGAMFSETGVASEVDAAALQVLEAWAKHTNATGGIGGHPVELKVEDTRNDPSQGVSLAEEFIADEDITAVFLASNGVEGAVGPLFAESDLAVTGVGYNPTVWSALPNFYTVATTFPASINLMAASAAAVGAENAALVACVEGPDCLSAAELFETASEAEGLEYTGALQVAAQAPNYTAECLRMLDEDVQFAQLNLASETAGRLVTDCLRQGYDGWFGASLGTVAPKLYADVPGIRLAGGIFGFPWWSDAAPVEEFRAAMEEQDVSDEVYGNPHSTAVWAAAELFRAALAGVDEETEVTRAMVQEGYGTIQGETLDGLLPQEISYAAGEPAPPVNCYWLYSYEDGEFSGGNEPSCEEPIA